MIKSERHIIKRGINHSECHRVCHLSKNLYNATLYAIRQQYFENKTYLNYYSLNKIFKESNNYDYRELPSKVSQQTMKLVEQNFKSFFGSIKLKNKKSRIPRYKEKDGLVVATYTNQAISKPLMNKGILRLSKTEISIKTKVPFERLQQVRIIPRGNHFVIEVLYKTDDVSLLPDNDRYASIDLGVNNLAMIGSNICEPKFISGKPLKSINQFYNKQVAKYKSLLEKINNKKTSKRIKSLILKRNNRVSDYLHKTSRMIINHLVSNQINTLVIGYNSGWKQEINIGRVNNQKFVNIPFLKLINQLEYKAKEAGINIVITNESYTSKCSFLDSEEPKKQKIYKGKRIKRGLFVSNNGKIINADLNGAMNILTKVIGKFNYNPIVACSTPIKLNV